jgi:threonine dehydrogenase-like Zn-dependent dehydrogenase
MRAAVAHGARDVRVETRDVPEPGPGEARVRVRACGLCGSDRHFYALGAYGPGVVPGHEIAGVVDAVGDGVDGWSPGDPVAVEPLSACGRCGPCLRGLEAICTEGAIYGVLRDGGFAEHLVVPARRLFRVPKDLAASVAALAEPAAVAIHGLRRVRMEHGARVLVLGAGPVGLMSLVAAQRLGASQVWISARYDAQAQAARNLGADRVLGEGEADLGLAPAHERPDIVVETVGGAADTLSVAARAVAPGGGVSVLGLFLGDVSLPGYPLLAKEVTLAWSNCYARRTGSAPERADFDDAVDLVNDERERLALFTTHSVGLDEVARAYALTEERPAGFVKATVCP